MSLGGRSPSVGGLWNTVNETVSIALASGCREATEIDIQPLKHELWQRLRDRGVPDFNCVSGRQHDSDF